MCDRTLCSRSTTVVWAFVEVLIFGSVINGWASLVYVLKEEGLFSDRCPGLDEQLEANDDKLFCQEQDDSLNFCYTVTIALQCVFGIIVGFLDFKCGRNAARFIGSISYTLGSIAMAFTNIDYPWLLLPGLIGVTYGGVTLLITNIPLSILFPRLAGIIVTFISGAFDFSASGQLIVKLLHDNSLLSRKTYFLTFGIMHAVMAITNAILNRLHWCSIKERSINALLKANTADIHPRLNQSYVVCKEVNSFISSSSTQLAKNGLKSENISEKEVNVLLASTDRSGIKDLQTYTAQGCDNAYFAQTCATQVNRDHGVEEGYVKPLPVNGNQQSMETAGSSKLCENIDGIMKSNDNFEYNGGEIQVEQCDELFTDLRSCFMSPLFWIHTFWTSVNVLRLVTFYGLINSKLTLTFAGDKAQVSSFTNAMAYTMLATLLVCWVSGAIYDWQASLLRRKKHALARNVLPSALPIALTSTLGVAISVLWLLSNESIFYAMFACLVFFHTSIFGNAYNYIIHVFPECYFGIINGANLLIVGSLCFLQYAIFHWQEAYPNGDRHAAIFMLILIVISFLHPLFIVVSARKTAIETK